MAQSVTPAIAAFMVGGIMLTAGIRNKRVVDIATFQDGPDVPGGSPGAGGAAPPGGTPGLAAYPDTPMTSHGWTAPPGGAHGFKGPHAALLNDLASAAQNQFDLRITATTNGGHVPGSWHYHGRAFDAAGSESNMRAFAKYVRDNHRPQILELIHNPGFAIKNGQNVNGAVTYAAVWLGHRDHVHTAA